MIEQNIITKTNGDKDKRINELTEENNLLIKQIQIIQRELEKYYNKLKECEQQNNSRANNSITTMPAMVQDAFEENIKLRALQEQQKIALQVERTNSLAARLGETLIKGVSSVSSFIILPVKLLRIWKALNNIVPPPELGGKDFSKILDLYTSCGIEKVEKLLDSIFLSSVMRANAYTALARHVMLSDVKLAANLARKAWETDPRPYRLKWLAFRIHEANDPITAEAILNMLPEDVNMTPSEERHAMRIKTESKSQCIEQAKEIINTSKYIISIKENNKIQEEYNLKFKELQNKHQKEIIELKELIEKEKEKSNKYLQDTIHANKTIEEIQHKMELQKKESDNFTLRISIIIKNLLTQFELDTEVLSQLIRIIMMTKENDSKKTP